VPEDLGKLEERLTRRPAKPHKSGVFVKLGCWGVIIIAALVLIGLGAAAIGFFRAYLPVSTVKNIIAAQNKALASSQPDFTKAHDMCSDEFKRRVPLEDFKALVKSRLMVFSPRGSRPYSKWDVEIKGDSATVSVRVASGACQTDLKYGFVRDRAGWKIDWIETPFDRIPATVPGKP
jgi:hypothetical protein